MPEALPPRLHEEIVWLLTPRREFKLVAERIDLIDPHLVGWDGRHDLDWSGAPHPFFERLLRQAPGPQLKQVLHALLIGFEGEQQVAELCQQIDDALHLATAAATRPFAEYYQALVRELSSDRYQLDSRFVQLTLLVDQGPEAQGVRFVQDRRRTFNSLNQLLTEVEDRALVLLGDPGSGKTTLLRRLQLEMAWSSRINKSRFLCPSMHITNGKRQRLIRLPGWKPSGNSGPACPTLPRTVQIFHPYPFPSRRLFLIKPIT